MIRNQKGFTLIELLIVVVIIGILAAIAIPKFSATREKAYFSAMKSDLRNLAAQQELYYSNEYSYADDESNADLEYAWSSGVVVDVLSGDGEGWSANAKHDALATTEGCAVYHGEATAPTDPITPGTPGVIACTDGSGS